MAKPETIAGLKPDKPNPFVSMAVYGLSVLMLKGFSLITIPLYARYLDPAEYGKLDIAVSIIEFVGLCASLGLADTLYRFASTGEAERRREAQAEVFGSGLIGAAIITLLVQLIAPAIHDFFSMTVGIGPLRAGLFAATVTGLVEMPLAWMRLHDRAFFYLAFVAGRTLTQIALTWAMLANGFGVAAILYATFAINIASGAVFAVIGFKDGGIRFSRAGLSNMAHYGLPLVGGGLAMYALGTFDRLFLAHAVTPQSIGHYAIAAKLALATALFIQPLALWWYPKRIAALDLPGGVARNAEVWGIGFVILIAGASFTALAMPLFVTIGLPSAYSGALAYLPWLVLASLMNELVSLSSAGAYKRQKGYEILTVNSVAALVALTGYVLLIPEHGIAGAIASTLAAHAVRLVIFIHRSRQTAPVPLVNASALAVAIGGLVPVIIAANGISVLAQTLLVLTTPGLVFTIAVLTGVIRLPRWRRSVFA